MAIYLRFLVSLVFLSSFLSLSQLFRSLIFVVNFSQNFKFLRGTSRRVLRSTCVFVSMVLGGSVGRRLDRRECGGSSN